MVDFSFGYSRFRDERATVPTLVHEDWGTFCDRFERFGTSPVKERLAFWSPATYPAIQHRSSENVGELTALVLDIDNGTEPRVFRKTLAPYARLTHSSFSHTESYPKWRAVLPFSRPVLASEWARVYRRLSLHFGRGMADPVCKDAARGYFMAVCHPDRLSDAFCSCGDGELLDPYAIEGLDEEPVILPAWAIRKNRANRGESADLVPLDFAKIAAGEIADGQKHLTLIRAMYALRMRGTDLGTCKSFVETALHAIGRERLRGPLEDRVAYYLREVDRTWERFDPDCKGPPGEHGSR